MLNRILPLWEKSRFEKKSLPDSRILVVLPEEEKVLLYGHTRSGMNIAVYEKSGKIITWCRGETQKFGKRFPANKAVYPCINTILGWALRNVVE